MHLPTSWGRGCCSSTTPGRVVRELCCGPATGERNLGISPDNAVSKGNLVTAATSHVMLRGAEFILQLL